MHEEQTRGTAQVSQRRMQLAKNSLTSQREDTAAEQRKHARLEDLHGLSYPSSQDLQRHCIYQTASRLTALCSDECMTDANNLLVAKHTAPQAPHTAAADTASFTM